MTNPIRAPSALMLIASITALLGVVGATSALAQEPSPSTSAIPTETPAPAATPSPTATASPTATPLSNAVTTVVAACPFAVPQTGPVVNIAAASVIVIGRAGETSSYFDEVRRFIFSNTTFHVEAMLRGSVAATITVRTLGGTVDGLTQASENQPVFTAGQRSRLFLELQDDGTYAIVGLAAGKQDLPPGVAAADPACNIPPAALPETGGRQGAHEPAVLALLAVLGGVIALVAGGVLAKKLARSRD